MQLSAFLKARIAKVNVPHPGAPTPDHDYYLYVSLHHIDNIEGPDQFSRNVAWLDVTTPGLHPCRRPAPLFRNPPLAGN